MKSHRLPETLTLDANHVYRLGDRILPSVTTVIRDCDAGWPVHQWYLDRGKAVHESIHLAMKGTLDWSSVDKRIIGRVKAALKFIEDEKLEPMAMEVKLYSSRYLYAGTLDFYGRTPKKAQFWLCDWKGSLSPHCAPQMGAYNNLLVETSENPVDFAVAVETHDDGSYKLKWFRPAELKLAFNLFLSMLTISGWKSKHGLTPKEP